MTAFYAKESCGTCTPCRAGLSELAAILCEERPDISKIGRLARYIGSAARCGLGQAAVSPVLSWLEGWCCDEN